MQVNNQTRRTVVTKELVSLTTTTQRMVGNIGQIEPLAVLIRTRFGIHTFGVRFPLDILVLDKTNRVVRMKKDLQPNKMFFWDPQYTTVIELPEKAIEKSKTKIGDRLSIV